MKSTETVKKTLVLSLAVLSVMSGQAMASESGERDGKVYPGSICVAQRWDQINATKYNLRGESEYRSNTFGITDLVCPIVRDNTSAKNGLEIVFVYFEDNHRYTDISCRVSSWDGSEKTGEPDDESSIYKSSGTGKGSLSMYFPITSSNYWTYYTVNCKLPGKYRGRTSRITSIRVAERP